MEAKEAIVVKENQLQVILKESGLEESKAAFILRNFNSYFELADEWTIKARAIVVTRADQEAEMAMAKTGRLFLRQKRLSIEGARKELKEQALREGKAIDGIANVLKALIIPIEEYLENQEKFVERQEEAKREAMCLEIEARIESERLAQERKEAEEREKLRLDNLKLKEEAKEREIKALAERVEAEKVLAKEREKAETARKAQEKKLAEERAKADMEKKLIEEKARLEREKQEKTLANEKAKAKRLAELAEEKAQAAHKKIMEDAVKERKEKERLAELLKAQVTCPKCGHSFDPKNGRK